MWAGCAGLLLLFVALESFGNSLEPISPFCALYPTAMLLAWYRLLQAAKHSSLATAGAAVLFIACQTLAWTIGYFKLLSEDATTLSTVAIVVLMGVASSTALTLLCFLPSSAFWRHYPTSPATPLVFPVTWTATFFLLGLSPISTFDNPANGLLDYSPIAGLASMLGLHGINFLLAAVSSYVHVHVSPPTLAPHTDPPHPALGPSDPPPPSHKAHFRRHYLTCYATTILLLSGGSSWLQQRSLYQRDITTEQHPTLSASCILAPGYDYPSPWASTVLSQTTARLAAKDRFILWSETALLVANTSREQALLTHLQALIIASPSNVSHLGATFFNDETSSNTFVLFAPDGSIAWRYQKAHPVPFINDGTPGSGVLPTYESPGLGLKLGGAICFDMDYPEFIRQAGANRVDLFLQVSNTWGAVGHRHFRGNALRAVENGMSYFRCSSGGESGVVTPLYEIMQRRVTLFNGTTTYDIPVFKHLGTLYVAGGWLLPYLCCLLAGLAWGLAVRTVVVWGAGQGRAGWRGAAEQRQPLLPQLNGHAPGGDI